MFSFVIGILVVSFFSYKFGECGATRCVRPKERKRKRKRTTKKICSGQATNPPRLLHMPLRLGPQGYLLLRSFCEVALVSRSALTPLFPTRHTPSILRLIDALCRPTLLGRSSPLPIAIPPLRRPFEITIVEILAYNTHYKASMECATYLKCTLNLSF